MFSVLASVILSGKLFHGFRTLSEKEFFLKLELNLLTVRLYAPLDYLVVLAAASTVLVNHV